MKFYNKLVRDKIPEIIAGDNGKTCVTRIMEDDEYLETLNTKMQEELKEYLESGDVEELADLEEVLRAILDIKGVSYEEFEKIRDAKVDERGAFKKKIFLESVSEKNDRMKLTAKESLERLAEETVSNPYTENHNDIDIATIKQHLEKIEAKETPLKLYYEADGYSEGELVYDTAVCSTCGRRFEVYYEEHYNYCPTCGQRLDWSD